MPEIVDLPSGLKGEIRGLNGKEIQLLTNKELAKSALLIDRIIGTCWIQTIEPGPYKADDKGKLDWSKVLHGDRVYLLIRVSAATFGKRYPFTVHCRVCKKEVREEVDLLELPVKKLSEEDLATFETSGLFQRTLPDGRAFTFRLPNGDDEVRETKAAMRGGEEAAVPATAVSRIDEIEGIEGAAARRRYFDEGVAGLVFEALQIMQEPDCGVDTAIQVECSNAACGATTEIDLPLDRLLAPRRRPKPS